MRQPRRRSLTIRAAVILALLGAPLLGAPLLGPGTAVAEPPYDPETHETSVDLPGQPNSPSQPACAA